MNEYTYPSEQHSTIKVAKECFYGLLLVVIPIANGYVKENELLLRKFQDNTIHAFYSQQKERFSAVWIHCLANETQMTIILDDMPLGQPCFIASPHYHSIYLFHYQFSLSI